MHTQDAQIEIKPFIVENTSRIDDATIEKRIEANNAKTRQDVAAVLRDVFKGLYIHVGGMHVAVVNKNNERLVMITSHNRDWK